MKKIIILISLYFFYFSPLHSEEWKIKNKWKVSCGIVDEESLVVNGKPIKKFNKKEFKLENVILTPHVCGSTYGTFSRRMKIVGQNINNFYNNKKLLNIVEDLSKN